MGGNKDYFISQTKSRGAQAFVYKRFLPVHFSIIMFTSSFYVQNRILFVFVVMFCLLIYLYIRTAMFDFCNNEEVKHLYIYSSTTHGNGLTASLAPPNTVREKSMFFVKSHGIGKVTRDNVMDDVAFCDCSNKPLDYLGTLTRDVYLPLLSIEMGGSVSADKLMDLLHRLVSNMEVVDGTIKVMMIICTILMNVKFLLVYWACSMQNIVLHS